MTACPVELINYDFTISGMIGRAIPGALQKRERHVSVSNRILLMIVMSNCRAPTADVPAHLVMALTFGNRPRPHPFVERILFAQPSPNVESLGRCRGMSLKRRCTSGSLFAIHSLEC